MKRLNYYIGFAYYFFILLGVAIKDVGYNPNAEVYKRYKLEKKLLRKVRVRKYGKRK